MRTQFEAFVDWQADTLHDEIKQCAQVHQLGMGKVAQPIRVAVTGTAVSPPLDVTLALLGRDRVLSDISRAIDWIKSNRI